MFVEAGPDKEKGSKKTVKQDEPKGYAQHRQEQFSSMKIERDKRKGQELEQKESQVDLDAAIRGRGDGQNKISKDVKGCAGAGRRPAIAKQLKKVPAQGVIGDIGVGGNAKAPISRTDIRIHEPPRCRRGGPVKKGRAKKTETEGVRDVYTDQPRRSNVRVSKERGSGRNEVDEPAETGGAETGMQEARGKGRAA